MWYLDKIASLDGTPAFSVNMLSKTLMDTKGRMKIVIYQD